MSVTYGADAISANYGSLPKGVQYAGYSTGSGDVPWTAAQWNANPGAIRICQDPGATDTTADILDVESGAATLADCPVWAKAARANFAKVTRPGQRTPAIYCSQGNVTSVVNALIAGGVTSGIGLWVANWNLSAAQAEAGLANSSGPFPVIGYQYEDAGSYDLDVWLSSWLGNRSKKGAVMQSPPGQWNNAATWSWKEVTIIGTGLDGNLHVFTFNPASGEWAKTE